MFIYEPHRMTNNVQLFLVVHEIILHIHNNHNAIAIYVAETWGRVLMIAQITQI